MATAERRSRGRACNGLGRLREFSFPDAVGRPPTRPRDSPSFRRRTGGRETYLNRPCRRSPSPLPFPSPRLPARHPMRDCWDLSTWPAHRPDAPAGAAASTSAPRTTDENTDSCLAAVPPSRSALPQSAPFPAHCSRVSAASRIRCQASLPPPRARSNFFGQASSPRWWFVFSNPYSLIPIPSLLTATPYPIARPSSASPVVPAASESLHPDTTSIFRFLPTAPSRCRAGSASLPQTVLAAPPHFVARVATPAAPLLSRHPSREPADPAA